MTKEKKNPYGIKTEKLNKYMKLRSFVEGLNWGLDTDYLEPYFINGVREFFGVHLDDNGNLLYDDQEPYDGFTEGWRNGKEYYFHNEKFHHEQREKFRKQMEYSGGWEDGIDPLKCK